MKLATALLSLFTKKEKYGVLAILVGMLAGAALETIGIGLLIPYIAFIGAPETIHKYKILEPLLSRLNGLSYSQTVVALGLGLLALYILKNLVLIVFAYFQNRFLFNKQVSLSRALLNTYMRKPYRFHLKTNSADIHCNVGAINTLLQGVLFPMFSLVSEGLVVLAIIAMLVALAPGPTIVAIVGLGLPSLLFYKFIRVKMYRLGEAKDKFNRIMTKWLNQSTGGIKEIQVLGRSPYFVDAYAKATKSYTDAFRSALVLTQTPRLFLETIAVGTVVFLVCFFELRKHGVSTELPTLGLFVVAMGRLMPSMTRVIGHVSMIRHCQTIWPILAPDFEEMRRHEQGHFGWNSESRRSQDRPPSIPFERALEFKDVCFRYDGRERETLKNINISVTKGSSVGIIGPSGSGKTTLVDLVLGVLQPTSGAIYVDGFEISKDMAAWQTKVGYVPQVIYLTDDTIRRNIAFGIPDEQIDNDKVWRSLRAAQLEEYANSLPEGLETNVGERGVRMSGGQRQRIGIARALYNDPDLLILDEATSALDSQTEQEVTHAIESLIGIKTLIIIAHRLTTVKKCDRLIRLVDGSVLESGTFHEIGEKLA